MRSRSAATHEKATKQRFQVKEKTQRIPATPQAKATKNRNSLIAPRGHLWKIEKGAIGKGVVFQLVSARQARTRQMRHTVVALLWVLLVSVSVAQGRCFSCLGVWGNSVRGAEAVAN